MASEAISEHQNFKKFLRKYAARPPVLHACVHCNPPSENPGELTQLLLKSLYVGMAPMHNIVSQVSQILMSPAKNTAGPKLDL